MSDTKGSRPSPDTATPAGGLDRRQLLTAAAGIAASLGIPVVAPAKAAARPRSWPARDVGPFDSFRQYVKALEDRGLVMRVKRLDQDQYEMTALTYRLMDEFGWYGAPALLVEEIKQDGRWLKGPVITNHQGHWDTEAIIWGREPIPGKGPETYRETIKFLLEGAEAREGKTPSIPTNPVAADKAPVKEVILRGEQCNVLDFAFIKSNPADSNRYVNTASVFTEDKELGMNFGTYRCEIKGPRLMGVNPEPGQQGWKMFMKKIERGEKRCPVALVMGNDPIGWFISSSVVSKSGADELAIAGGFRNKAVDVVKCETNDMLIPANAELVIEGEVLLDQMQPEGPFGEMYGYLGLKKDENFVMEVTCITHRKQPWILNQFTGVTRGFCTAPLEAFSFYRLKKSIPNAVAFHSPVEWTGIGILSIDKTGPKQGLEAGRKIAQFVPITKACIVVDKDVDVLNRTEVMQAVGARWQPYPGAEIIKEARGMALDPSSPKRPMSSKIVIDATRQLPEEGGPKVYPERNRDLLVKLAPESFNIVERNWDQYLRGWKRDA
ncbi:MAG: UbiD family decarboxylase [Gammaproteobacteria bacterium]|nr:UbiD family decarboxylase [Gammaproteobacteria bacterium]